MNRRKAKILCHEIKMQISIWAQTRQIGNGEWVVIVDRYFHLWSLEDWEAYKLENFA